MTTRYWRPTRNMLRSLRDLKNGDISWRDLHKSTLRALVDAGWLHPRTNKLTSRGRAALWIYEEQR